MTIEKEIKVIISAVDEFSSTTSSFSKKFGSLGDAIEATAKPLANMYDKVKNINLILTGLAVGGLTLAFNAAKEFESSQIELAKVIGDESGKMDEAVKTALEMSGVYGQSSSEILESIANWKQSGKTMKESMVLVKDAMDLVIAGGIDSSRSTEILSKSLNGFNAPAEDARRILDGLNAVSNNYATNVAELADGFSSAAPTANLLGLSYEQLMGTLVPMIEVFGSGSESATAFNTGMGRILKDSDKTRGALANIGVAQKDSNGNLRNGVDILNDIMVAFKGVDDNQKILITSQLVGVEQAKRMVTVFDGLEKVMGATSTAMNGTGSAAEEVAIRLQSAEVILDRFKVGFKNLSKVIGDKFLESSKQAIDGGTAIENALQRMVKSGTFDELFNALNGFTTKIGDTLKGIAQALPEAFLKVDFSGLLNSFDEIGNSLGDLFGDIDLTDPGDLTKVIQTVVDTLESLGQVAAGMIEQFQPFWDAIKEGISSFNTMDITSKQSFGGVLTSAKMVVDAGLAITGAIIAIGTAGAEMKNVFDVIIGTIQGLFYGFQTVIDSVAVTVQTIMLGIVKIVADKVQGITDAFLFAEGVLGGFVPDSLLRGVTSLNKSLQVTVATLEGGLEIQAAEVLKDAAKATDGWKKAVGGIKNEFSDVEKNVTATKKATNEVKTVTEQTKEGIIKTAERTKKVVDETTGWKTSIEKVDKAVVKVDESIDKTKNATEDISKELTKWENAKIDMNVKAFESALKESELKLEHMQELSKLNVELSFELDIEKVNAAKEIAVSQAAVMESAFNSVSETMTSIGGEINTLVDAFSSIDVSTEVGQERSQQLADAIQTAQFQRSTELNIQKTLVDAQSEWLKSQARLMDIKGNKMLSGFNEYDIGVTVEGDTEGWLKGLMQSLFEEIMLKAEGEAFSVFGTNAFPA